MGLVSCTTWGIMVECDCKDCKARRSWLIWLDPELRTWLSMVVWLICIAVVMIWGLK